MNAAPILSNAALADLRVVNRGWGWHVLGLAGAFSLIAHGGLLTAFMPGNDILIEGGAPASVAALGNSFRDYTRGALPTEQETATSVEPDTPPPPAPQETAEMPPSPVAPHSPEITPTHSALEAVAPLTPPNAARQQMAALEEARPPEQADAPNVASAPASWSPPATASMVVQSERAIPVASLAAPSETVTPSPVIPAAQASSFAAASPVPLDVTSAAPEVEVQTARADTPRPRQRPDLQERQRQQEQQARAQAERQRQAQRAAQTAGDADRNARRGSDRGREQASAAVAAQREAQARALAQANAAISNYPGQVMRRIQRQRRPRVNARGGAVVSFSVSSGGGLASARVARSSGSRELDRAALALVRRAAPFPAPPAGARRNFSVEILGR